MDWCKTEYTAPVHLSVYTIPGCMVATVTHHSEVVALPIHLKVTHHAGQAPTSEIVTQAQKSTKIKSKITKWSIHDCGWGIGPDSTLRCFHPTVADTQSRQIWASISGHHQNIWVGLFMVELGYLEPKEHLGTTRSSRI